MARSQLFILLVAYVLGTLATAGKPNTNFMRELLISPEVDACLKERGISEQRISTYLEIMSSMKERCDRLKRDFEDCLDDLREMDDDRDVFRTVDYRVTRCQFEAKHGRSG